MIIDQITELRQYAPLLPALDNALATLEGISEFELKKKYPFEGGYLMKQAGETKFVEDGRFEAHRKYIDVQLILSGSEFVIWEPLEQLESVIPYDEEKDMEKLSGDRSKFIKIVGGMFYVMYPQDGHQPVCHFDQPTTYEKIVIKLALPQK